MNGSESQEDNHQPTARSSFFRDSVLILAHPRVVIRRLIQDDNFRGYWTLPALVGVLTAPTAAMTIAALVEGFDLVIWAGAIILSVLGFWMYVHVYGYAYRLIGSWYGAGGTNQRGRLALAWTQVPFIVVWAIVVPLQILHRDEFFPEIDLATAMSGSLAELQALLNVEHSAGYAVTNWITYLGLFVAYVWSLFVLGEALECSAWKAFLIKMMAFLLHIPLFIVLTILAVFIALAFVTIFPPM